MSFSLSSLFSVKIHKVVVSLSLVCVRQIVCFKYFITIKSHVGPAPSLLEVLLASFISQNVVELHLKPQVDKWKHIFSVDTKSALILLTTNVLFY